MFIIVLLFVGLLVWYIVKSEKVLEYPALLSQWRVLCVQCSIPLLSFHILGESPATVVGS